MKKSLFWLAVFLISILISGVAFGSSFTFSDNADGGIASASLSFSGLDSATWIVTINNDSPTTLIGSSDPATNPNVPGITGVGFDYSPTSGIASWKLEAIDLNNNFTEINSDWELAEPGGSGIFVLDALFNTVGGNDFGPVNGGLYNPFWQDLSSISSDPSFEPLGGPPVYFTEAVLTINFVEAATLIADGTSSPFVRFQNVGQSGDGSLKVPGNPVPEPATLLLLGFGFIGLAGYSRKKLNKGK